MKIPTFLPQTMHPEEQGGQSRLQNGVDQMILCATKDIRSSSDLTDRSPRDDTHHHNL
jgi:hypothetical protein